MIIHSIVRSSSWGAGAPHVVVVVVGGSTRIVDCNAFLLLLKWTPLHTYVHI